MDSLLPAHIRRQNPSRQTDLDYLPPPFHYPPPRDAWATAHDTPSPYSPFGWRLPNRSDPPPNFDSRTLSDNFPPTNMTPSLRPRSSGLDAEGTQPPAKRRRTSGGGSAATPRRQSDEHAGSASSSRPHNSHTSTSSSRRHSRPQTSRYVDYENLDFSSPPRQAPSRSQQPHADLTQLDLSEVARVDLRNGEDRRNAVEIEDDPEDEASSALLQKQRQDAITAQQQREQQSAGYQTEDASKKNSIIAYRCPICLCEVDDMIVTMCGK